MSSPSRIRNSGEEVVARRLLVLPMSDVSKLRGVLLDLSEPIAKRTHAAFHLRTIGSAECVEIIAEALKQRQDGELMRHELAYILGQMQNSIACDTLIGVLEDENDDVLVRHESAEALGAIGDIRVIDVLKKYVNHPAPEISETCIIAIDLLEWRTNGEQINSKGIYLSVDPAPPLGTNHSIENLQNDLMDNKLSLFQRYRAMFSLRDINSDDSALALLQGFKDSSALFRHEIAYVLGQMQRSVTAEGLMTVLENKEEHRMVRHEAAEALGAIGGAAIEEVLGKYKDNDDIVVVQSCEVALDTIDYWVSNGF